MCIIFLHLGGHLKKSKKLKKQYFPIILRSRAHPASLAMTKYAMTPRRSLFVVTRRAVILVLRNRTLIISQFLQVRRLHLLCVGIRTKV
jgi:hypothetical protein